MGGGLMQLVAYGAQDIYLTGQPQITFFKSVYRRHTNFAVESIVQTINGTVNAGTRVSVLISRNGDLLKNLWVQYNPSGFSYDNSVISAVSSDLSHAMLQIMELEIGGQLIDRQYGMWLTVWRDLSEVNPTGNQGQVGMDGLEPQLNQMGEIPSTRYQRMAYTHQSSAVVAGGESTLASAPIEVYVPMRFWFCKNPGLAIPLIALQYHEVKFNIQFQQNSNLFVGGNPSWSGINLQIYADYVYLDTTERRQFAQNAHEYLIDQLQSQEDGGSGGASSETIRLNFNHPVKELIWVGQGMNVQQGGSSVDDSVFGPATPGQLTETMVSGQTKLSARIVLNGTDRFTSRNLNYFTRNQIWDTHTGFGAVGNPDSIAVYSFALRPEEHQPSGTCNFSRIDTAQLNFQGAPTNPMYIYAVNYNVLRIMSGMGGLAYSN